jgi:hypothetical protein
MKTIKERAKAIYLQWAESTEFDSSGANAYAMGCLLQEIANAPEPEPVAHAILLPNGATRIWFSDRDSGELWRSRERVEQELTPLYAIPPANNQSEQPLEMVNPPAPPADLARDAERYRWLRTYNTAKHPAVTEAFFLGDENLDAEIDAAIAAKKGGAA